MAPKHVPMRTCIQCREVRPKRQLVRIVRTPQGGIEIDERGKAAGRGAYLCRDRACWEEALAAQSLDHSLKVKLTGAVRAELLAFGRALPHTSETSDEKGDAAAPAVEG